MMNPRKIVKLSNYIGLVAIFCLVYWVFIFMSMTILDLKIFQEQVTEAFFLSIFSIIVVMIATLMINIMFNLTRIAEKHNTDQQYANTRSKLWVGLLIISFPVLFGALILGHNLSMSKRQQLLISSAHSVLKNYSQSIQSISAYHFDPDWIKTTKESLTVLSKTDSEFPRISVIVKDQLDNGSTVYLSFDDNRYSSRDENDNAPTKIDFLLATTQQQREYLDRAFKDPHVEVYYERNRNDYKLFVPYQHEGNTVVFSFGDYYPYGSK